MELDPNIKSDNGSNALFWATESGHFEVIKLLLNYIDINYNHATTGINALMYATKGGYYEIAKFLLDNGAIITCGALIWAASEGHIEIVRLLLDRGADPNYEASVKAPQPAIIHAVSRGDIEMVRLLLERGANPNTVDLGGQSAIMFAPYLGGVSKLLLKHIELRRKKVEQYNIFKNPQMLINALNTIETLTDVVKEKHIARLIFNMKVQMEHV